MMTWMNSEKIVFYTYKIIPLIDWGQNLKGGLKELD